MPHVNEIINRENTPKEIVKSFIDLTNIAKGLMDENQQLSSQQEFERVFPSTRGEGGRGGGGGVGESREPHKAGAGDPSAYTATGTNTSFATLLPQNGQLQKFRGKKLVEFAIFCV